MDERFPLHKNGVLLLLTFSAIYGISLVYYKNSIRPVVYCAAVIAYILFFLHLRLMDEFKDFSLDSKYKPWRPVQRGLVSLKELGFVMIPVIALELILAAFTGFSGLIWMFSAVVYSFLMWKEFFAGKFLSRHIYLYAITHGVVIIPLTCFAVAAAARPDYGMNYVVLNAAVFCTSFSYEIARKVKRPQEEQKGVETYTSASGENAPVAILIVLNIIMGAAGYLIAASTARPVFFGMFFFLLAIAYITGVVIYITGKKKLKKGVFIESLTGACILSYSIALNIMWIFPAAVSK